jgi:hypothetical protein
MHALLDRRPADLRDSLHAHAARVPEDRALYGGTAIAARDRSSRVGRLRLFQRRADRRDSAAR